MAASKAYLSTTQVVESSDGTFVSPPCPPPPDGLYAETEPDWGTINVAVGFESVTAEHVAAYAADGYLVVKGAYNSDVVFAAHEAIDRMCAETDERFEAACAGHKHDPEAAAVGQDCPGIQLEAAGEGLPKGHRAQFVRKLKNFHGVSKELDCICFDTEAWGLIARLLGLPNPDLEIFQSIALLKLAKVGREKPWHQDQAYFNIPIETTPSGAPTHVVGVWVAVEPATVANGCMQVLPGHGAPLNHFQRRDWQICDDQIPAKCAIALPMAPGDALFFSGLAPHGTPPNHTDRSRKAVQLHLVPKGYRRISTDDRLAVFGNEGKVCEC